MHDQRLIGRSAELAWLRDLTDWADGSADRALVLLGDPGTGKSAMLADLAAHAGARGLLVLSATGRERESGLAFAGLRQLLEPLMAELLARSGPLAAELRSAVGLDPPLAGCDRFRVGTALLELLAGPAGQGAGVLVAVDDAHWLDPASLDVLAFAARRLDRGRAAVVIAARGAVPPPGLDGGIPQLRLDSLTFDDAGALLDAQPTPPRGVIRAGILAQAAGNPLALTELTRAIAADPGSARRYAALPLPPTDRLTAVFAAGLGTLPDVTRHALLLVAAADPADREAIVNALSGLDPAVLVPAEEQGLLTVTAQAVGFRHPVIRSAVYHSVPFARRAAAHRELADVLRDQPDRRAWHLGAAAWPPDEAVASLLTRTAPQARRRGGAAAMALALERAADLSPEPADQAVRLVLAAEAAVSAGHPDWAADLAARALARPAPRRLRERAKLVTGRALIWSGRYASALEVLLPLARESDPGPAWPALGLAATAAYQAGDPASVRAVADTLAALPPGTGQETTGSRLWALAVTGHVRAAARGLRQRHGPHDSQYAGAAAWLLDQTTQAIELLRAAPDAPPALAWAYLDAGRWDEALTLTAGSGVVAATIEAARGHSGRARALITAALAASPEHGRLLTARARHALALCALADGDYPAAFGHLRQLFDDDGIPYHYHASYLATGDLALAAARAGQRMEGRELVKRIAVTLAGAGRPPSPRLRQQLARAHGILADPSVPAAYPGDVADDPAGDQWPFERAQLRLELGEWLRRHRRINQAKPVLSAALAGFRTLQARPWAHRAETELRACGIAVPDTTAVRAVVKELTPQQRQVIGLAAQGLSNREIAQRLFLSPRTVASHLYRSYPRLGVAGRHQLDAVLTGDGR
jgi:DNA-binding CsgD family transcriptional regulator/tetratricopeptide (TPR) repeat protein